MSSSVKNVTMLLLVLSVACSREGQPSSAADDEAGIDSLNARLAQSYRTRDPQMYGSLFSDSAAFEWPAFNTVRGRAGLEAMARGNWESLSDLDLQLAVADRRITADNATEVGAFQLFYRDAKGARMTEFGRYVHVLGRGPDDRWRIDRFFGFSDSTRPQTSRP